MLLNIFKSIFAVVLKPPFSTLLYYFNRQTRKKKVIQKLPVACLFITFHEITFVHVDVRFQTIPLAEIWANNISLSQTFQFKITAKPLSDIGCLEAINMSIINPKTPDLYPSGRRAVIYSSCGAGLHLFPAQADKFRTERVLDGFRLFAIKWKE